ncbi:MAG: dihydroneopterin aldolase [Candidatus Marinimicrobia bacterium]|nr:dihydroneopterin aldolase [Candidatus Neomarinimicrobiota bacterium]
MGTIKIKNMVFYGYHGTAREEKELGGKFEVDLDLYTNLNKAIETDDIQNTINYVDIYRLVKNIVTESKYHLIEALAGKILKEIFSAYRLSKVTIRLRKPNVPLHGVVDTVEVEITRTKEEMI